MRAATNKSEYYFRVIRFRVCPRLSVIGPFSSSVTGVEGKL